MEEEINTPNYPSMNSYMDSKADLLEKIKPDLIVEILRHKFLGEELINGKWVKISALQDNAISEKGAWELSTLMLPVSSQNVSLSKLKDTEIKFRALAISKSATYSCVSNWKEYGIKNGAHLRYIIEIIFSNTLITLKQPEGEGIRKLLQGTIHENRQVMEGENSKWDSIFRKR